MKLVFATGNAGKLKEVNEILESAGLQAECVNADLPEIKSESITETAAAKAKTAAELFNCPALADDTGLFFQAYPGFPGAFPKFVFKTLGYIGIFKLLEGRPRSATFVTAAAYCEPCSSPKVFEGKCKGRIAELPSQESNDGLPYDSIFVPENEDKAFAQMTLQKKAAYSQRAKAFRAMANWIREGKQ
ncbi:TPA: RdgB/HAM1 family non-canonical purine NTP pyrophosphatase [Candidatus Micrarchaeota archaeon]|nr:MAG: non-canonical purine NTP pyrophosphatase, RdgB/HAM1 family [Candidatus Micrarchaeota archaeon CG1_02_51_15]HII38582.1 RdgB/HAM1 family non-canonical purine NTP pyrophosphatase [Candidatus Micrarchaeota archaeon]